jgi:hypothetical protein
MLFYDDHNCHYLFYKNSSLIKKCSEIHYLKLLWVFKRELCFSHSNHFTMSEVMSL